MESSPVGSRSVGEASLHSVARNDTLANVLEVLLPSRTAELAALLTQVPEGYVLQPGIQGTPVEAIGELIAAEAGKDEWVREKLVDHFGAGHPMFEGDLRRATRREPDPIASENVGEHVFQRLNHPQTSEEYTRWAVCDLSKRGRQLPRVKRHQKMV